MDLRPLQSETTLEERCPMSRTFSLRFPRCLPSSDRTVLLVPRPPLRSECTRTGPPTFGSIKPGDSVLSSVGLPICLLTTTFSCRWSLFMTFSTLSRYSCPVDFPLDVRSLLKGVRCARLKIFDNGERAE